MLRAEGAVVGTVVGVVVVVSRRSPLLALKELKGSLASIAGDVAGRGGERVTEVALLLLRWVEEIDWR